MTDDRLAVVVLADAPRPGALPGLEAELGPERGLRLQRALIARAARWAAAVAAPGAAFLAYAPGDARDVLAALVPPEVELLPQAGGHRRERLAAAFAEAAHRTGRAVAIAGTGQPALGEHHARAAASDLRAGVDVTYGPSTDGDWYLLAAAEPHPALFAIDPEAWGGPGVLDHSLRAAVGAGLAVALLRSERPLATPADAAALRADPQAPPDIVAVLRASA